MFDPNALKAALGQAIDALSQVADMVAGDASGAPGGAPAPGAGGPPPAPAAPPAGGPPAPKKPEDDDSKPAAGKGMGDGQDMLQGMPGGAPAAPSVCPACGRPLEAHDGQPQQPMMQTAARKAATGDMSYGEFASADGPGDLAGGQEGAVIKTGRMSKASEPSGSDQFRPGKPEGSVPHDEGSNMGLGAPANPGNTRADTSQSGVEGAVIKAAQGGGDLKQILEGLINPLTASLNDLHDRIGAVEGNRQGRRSLQKSAGAPPTTETSEGYEIAEDATELPTQVWVDVLKGRTSIGDNSL